MRVQEVYHYLVEENNNLDSYLRQISLRQSVPFFSTQPVPYESPYSPKRLARSQASFNVKRNYRQQYHSPLLQKIEPVLENAS